MARKEILYYTLVAPLVVSFAFVLALNEWSAKDIFPRNPEPIAAPKDKEISIDGLYEVEGKEMTVRIWTKEKGYRVQWDRKEGPPLHGIGMIDRGYLSVGFGTPLTTPGRVAPGIASYKISLKDEKPYLYGTYMEADGKPEVEVLKWLK